MTEQQAGAYKESHELTKWTRWLLYLQVAIAIAALISGALEYQLLNDFKEGVYSSESEAIAAGEASDSRQRIVGIVQFLILVASGVVIMRWIHRANFNARQLGALGMKFTPGWSIGWYFIPIANLWKPYQAMKEIWQTSARPEDWKGEPVTPLLGWWWFFWIVSTSFGNASFRMTLRADQIDELIAANVVTQISDLTGIPLSIILLLIVGRIHEMQGAGWARMARPG